MIIDLGHPLVRLADEIDWHPTDARFAHRAIGKLVDLAKREGISLRQSDLRLAKRAAIMVGRYTNAH